MKQPCPVTKPYGVCKTRILNHHCADDHSYSNILGKNNILYIINILFILSSYILRKGSGLHVLSSTKEVFNKYQIVDDKKLTQYL